MHNMNLLTSIPKICNCTYEAIGENRILVNETLKIQTTMKLLLV